MNKLDKIIINVSAYLILLFITLAAVKNIAAAIFIAFLVWITANRIIIHLWNRKKDKQKTSVPQMEDLLALMGISGQIDLFVKSAPPCFDPAPFDCGFELTMNCEKILVFPNYKFSACSQEEIAKFYRIAKEKSVKTVWILSRLNNRSLILFANNLDVNFVFQSSRIVRNYLNKHNMLPSAPEKPKKEKKKINFKETFSGIFVKKRAKYFFLSGVSLAFLCIFTPLRIYYITLCAICLVLGVVCLLRESF